MAHHRRNYTTKPIPNKNPSSLSPVAHFMSPTATSSAHCISLLRSQTPRSFSFTTSNRGDERDLKPIYTPKTGKFTSPERYIRDPNNIPPSAPSSLYETGSSSLYTEGLATRMEEDEITSLERIRKRNSASMRLEDVETSAQSSFAVASSPSMLPTAQATKPAPADQRSLQIKSSPWVPLYTPPGFYLQPQANETTSTLPSSGDRRRTILSRKLSSMSLRDEGTGDIWEQALEDKENFDEMQSLLESKKKGAIARGFERETDQVIGKCREEELTPSPIDYVAKNLARRQDFSSRPQSVSSASPLSPFDKRRVYNSSSSPSLSQLRIKFLISPSTISDEKTEYMHPELQNDSVYPSSRSYSHVTPSPLLNHFLSRSLSSSSDEEIDIGSSPALSGVRPLEVLAQTRLSPSASKTLIILQDSKTPDFVKVTGQISLMTSTEVYSQAPIPALTELDMILPREISSPELLHASTYLTLMSPKSTYSQEPVPTLRKLTIMAPTSIYTQAPVPADSPWFFFTFCMILPLFLSTTQALAVALHHVDSEMGHKLVIEIIKGWLVGAVLGVVVHAIRGEVMRMPRDLLYMVAWLTGLLVWGLKRGIGNLVGAYRAGNGNEI